MTNIFTSPTESSPWREGGSFRLSTSYATDRYRHAMQLSAERIDVWCTFTDEIRDASLLSRYRDLLVEEEKRRMERFHFSKDRHQYLVARALVRSVLSYYVPIAPHEWRFEADVYGKPKIVNAIPMAQSISFNLSHTPGLVILGIASGRQLGVDVENIRIRSAPIDVAQHFFSADECTDILATPADTRGERFFQYWTLKESYIKARGMGLSIPLNQFGFLHGQRGWQLFCHAEVDDNPSRWHFRQFRLSPEHMGSLCIEHRSDIDQLICMRKTVPLASDVTYADQVLGHA